MDTKFLIPEESVHQFRKLVEKLNRRAVRVGAPPIICKITEGLTKEVTFHLTDGFEQDKGTVYLAPAAEVELTFEVLKLGEWNVVAKIDHEMSVPVMSVLPGNTAPHQYNNAEPYCDHCNKMRRRNSTYVLQDQKDVTSYRQIGRQCLREYTGVDPGIVLAVLALRDTIYEDINENGNDGDYSWNGYKGPVLIDIKRILEASFQVIKAIGYVSRKAADTYNEKADRGVLEPTSSVLSTVFFGTSKEATRIRTEIRQIEVDNIAELVTTWIDALPSSEYADTLKQLVKAEKVKPKYFGYLASAVAGYQKMLNQHAEKAARPVSNYVGNIGERIELTGKIISLRYLDGAFGVTTLVMIVDTAGNVYKWFASVRIQYEVNDEIHIKGSVKAHEEYNNRKETMLTRCKFL